MAESSQVLERGSIYFFYRPRVEDEAPESLRDVQRFHMVLSPDNGEVYRLIAVGRKRMPDVERGHERNWGFVERVTKAPEDMRAILGPESYETKTRGRRVQPAARPAGEGVYAIVKHGNHTHLAYELELPERPGPVQDELNVEKSGSYVVTVRNPGAPSRGQAGLARGERPNYPHELMDKFRGRRFGELDSPRFLDFEGAEIILIGADEEPGRELNVDLHAQDESEATAQIFRELRLERGHTNKRPLLRGQWA